MRVTARLQFPSFATCAGSSKANLLLLLFFFFAVAINSTNEANKSGGTWH